MCDYDNMTTLSPWTGCIRITEVTLLRVLLHFVYINKLICGYPFASILKRG